MVTYFLKQSLYYNGREAKYENDKEHLQKHFTVIRKILKCNWVKLGLPTVVLPNIAQYPATPSTASPLFRTLTISVNV